MSLEKEVIDSSLWRPQYPKPPPGRGHDLAISHHRGSPRTRAATADNSAANGMTWVLVDLATPTQSTCRKWDGQEFVAARCERIRLVQGTSDFQRLIRHDRMPRICEELTDNLTE
jgi:hypothetical protein